jgi:hypothetical protein
MRVQRLDHRDEVWVPLREAIEIRLGRERPEEFV